MSDTSRQSGVGGRVGRGGSRGDGDSIPQRVCELYSHTLLPIM